MACNTVNDYNASGFCDGAGGVKKWYAFPTFDDDGVHEVTFTRTSGLVTAVTVANPSTFSLKTWQVEMETSNFTDVGVGERTNKAYSREQTATPIFHGATAQMVADIDDMNKTRMTVIVEDNRGLLHVLGEVNGMSFRDSFDVGTMLTDPSFSSTACFI